MASFTLTDNVNIAQVGKSWVNANKASYICGQLPSTGRIQYRANGIKTTNYKLPAFGNSLAATGGSINWEPGDSLPSEQALGSEDIAVTPQGGTTRLFRVPQVQGGQNFEDLEGNITPLLMSQGFQMVDYDIIAHLTNASNYGQITFTGTGALDTFINDQTPYWNLLNKAIAPLRLYASSFPGLKVVFWLEDHVLDVLMAHWNFQGAGAAVGTVALSKGPMIQERDQLIALLSRNLRVEVKVFNSVGNTGAFGAAVSPQEQAFGLCWFGVVDTLAWDLSSENATGHKPDGGLQFGIAQEVEVDSFIEPGSKMETFRATWVNKIYSPRGALWGKLFPVGEIIT